MAAQLDSARAQGEPPSAAQAASPQAPDSPAPTEDSAVAKDQSVSPEVRYEAAIKGALTEYERGNFEEARENMRIAHELSPSARTLRGLGKVEFELRNYGESAKFLEAALASDTKPLDDGLRNEVQQLLTRARAYIGEVHVNVQPGTATVVVDGVTVASGPTAALELQVGDHVLEFRAAGMMPERRQIRVRGGEQTSIQVVLGTPPDDRKAAHLQTSERTPVYKRWQVWTAVGASVVAAVAVGLAVGLTRNDDNDGSRRGGSSGLVLSYQ